MSTVSIEHFPSSQQEHKQPIDDKNEADNMSMRTAQF